MGRFRSPLLLAQDYVTRFEFVLTGVSIVLVLAVAHPLGGLRDSFDPTRRYWLYSLPLGERSRSKSSQ